MDQEGNALAEVFEPGVERCRHLLSDEFTGGRVEGAGGLIVGQEADACAVAKPEIVEVAAQLAEIWISTSRGRGHRQGNSS